MNLPENGRHRRVCSEPGERDSVVPPVVAVATRPAGFGGVLPAVSETTRAVADRTVRPCRDGLRSPAR